ncbi:hypothetical protein [Carboxylicivirga marina]|uniref:hypothetical protein n=1 Tax=Carboxylicivirga marina TaxID=2800988 RepID=UPI00259685E7|nr:hypothetical protein [uncultured Carboxylicivirga sp.]
MNNATILIHSDNESNVNVFLKGKDYELAALLDLATRRNETFRTALLATANMITRPSDAEFTKAANDVVRKMESINSSRI